ncbi:Helix-turn-helix domain-containing protein [Rhodoblastus acidophilus]|uniref:Helix-turn-helix domain-containing protein n=1 Tax=Rhodoblastus acidophilus TaxID=1074 RepID=A0A212SAH1_RHOAC|nr:helix-turn-helix domain-containing protein [Rhodoblastus acidophilus]RAI20005.1 hypothetical protein CH337_10900 [Rhodoblastus acidophilus]SNB82537.1 Helix-turn-helix domain-containing protein [Rhodoblastus acidophilus]
MRSYSHLSEEERDQIGVLRAAGRSIGAIAEALGRPKCTISRELVSIPAKAPGNYEIMAPIDSWMMPPPGNGMMAPGSWGMLA